MNKTKIICTLGPAVDSYEKVSTLIEAGMNVARLNFSHGTYEEHGQRIAWVKEAREKAGVPLAIMLDTKGPEIRLGKLKGDKLVLKEGDQLFLIKESVEGTADQVTLKPAAALDALKKDMFVLLDNGYIITHVVEVTDRGVKIEVDHGGVIKSTRGVNIPGADVELPALTDQDIEDVRFGCRQDVDLIAASFVRSAEHVLDLKKILEDEGKPGIAVIAKIENRLGVQNFDSIIQVADGIMVARGDLGVELPLAQVPRLQKMMIRKCYLAGKPSVIATQMLESMIVNPRPTRAEVSDVANAIYDSTSAVMLSGETAVGSYAIETVKMMHGIIKETEQDFNYYEFFQQSTQRVFNDVPSSVAQASIKTAYSANAKAIFAFTTSGSTARLLARLRPDRPIVAMTPNQKVYHQLALNWGVIPLLCKDANSIEEAMSKMTNWALERGIVHYGDLVVIIGGRTHFGKPGTTNMIIVESIGDVLVRGNEGYGRRVHGQVKIVLSSDVKEYEIRGKIIIINKCDESYFPLLKHAMGIILQNQIDDVDSERYLKKMAQMFDLSVLLRADRAVQILRDDQLITLDPAQASIYKGVV